MLLKNIVTDEILSDIEKIEKDENLYLERNFSSRLRAIDYIEVHVIDRINAETPNPHLFQQTTFLIQYAIRVKHDLEDVNTRMFHQLRMNLHRATIKGKFLMDLIDEYFDEHLSECFQQETPGYDNLDIFLNGLLTNQVLPVETKDREPEMIFYQKTPARIILKLIRKADFKQTDVFFDLGSGLGHVNILVNLLTSVPSKGIEFEPAFCNYAKTCVAELNLNHVHFINIDARNADYSLGTVFFMYTPFEGKMLGDVLRKLQDEAKKRPIRIFTYGPCTTKVAQENWLVSRCVLQNSPGDLGEFISNDLFILPVAANS